MTRGTGRQGGGDATQRRPDMGQVREAREAIARLRAAGVAAKGYDLLPPGRRQMWAAGPQWAQQGGRR